MRYIDLAIAEIKGGVLRTHEILEFCDRLNDAARARWKRLDRLEDERALLAEFGQIKSLRAKERSLRELVSRVDP